MFKLVLSLTICVLFQIRLNACRLSSHSKDSSIAPNLITGDIGQLSKRTARLKVSGGRLAENATWKWYNSEYCKRCIGKGASITVRPKKPTTYYVRAENGPNTTAYAKVTVTPNLHLKQFFINFGVVPNFQQMKRHNILKESVDRISDNPTVAITLGSYRKSGWYLRGKYTLNSKQSTLHIQNNQVTQPNPNTYYVFDGSTANNRWSATAGLISKINRNSLFWHIGAGYGQRTFLWKTDDYSTENSSHQGTHWAKVDRSSFSGIEAETGLMVRVLMINLMAGGNFIFPIRKSGEGEKSYKTYVDAYVGVGFTL